MAKIVDWYGTYVYIVVRFIRLAIECSICLVKLQNTCRKRSDGKMLHHAMQVVVKARAPHRSSTVILLGSHAPSDRFFFVQQRAKTRLEIYEQELGVGRTGWV